MSDITTRAGKGSPLTHSEVDANFTNLNSDKYQSGDDATLGTVTAQTKVTSPRFENGIFTNDYLYLAGSTTGSALTGGLRFNIGQYGGDYSLTSGAKIESLKTSQSSGIEYLSFFSQSHGSSTDVSDASLFIYGNTVQIGSSTGGGYTNPKELVVAGNIYSTGFVEAETFRVRGSSTTALTLTSAGRVTTGENLIVTGDETVSGDLTVSQNLSVTGTATFGTTSISGFTSTGIDDNATETALTIDSNENVILNQNSAYLQLTGEFASNTGRIGISGSAAGGLYVKNTYTNSNSGAHFWNSGAVSLYSGNEDAVTAELQIDTNGIVQVGQYSGTDFRVDTDTLAVDASADRVGINTSSPSTELHVKGVSAGDLATLTIESTATNLVKGTSTIKLLSQATDYTDQEFEIAAIPGGATTGGKFIAFTSGGSTSGVGSFAFVSRAAGGTGASTTLAAITPTGIEAPSFRASATATTTALSITDAGQVTAGEDLIVTGDETIGGDLTVSGNLTVQGTTTTIDTANLNVEDNNITLNYSTGDSSGSANGAGITIQDAVDSTTDATILWDSINDTFDFSHAIDVAGNITLSGTVDGRDIATDGTKLDGIEASADVTDATNVAAAGAVMDGDFTANGFMKRTGAGTYTVDTNTYLTSYTETDTLDSVTTRGATTTNDITVGNLTSTGIDDNATSTALTITGTGRVGIDNTNPAQFPSDQQHLVVGSGSGNVGATIYSGTTGRGNLKFADGTGLSDSVKGAISYDHNTDSLSLTSNESVALTINSSGNVSIGTTGSAGVALTIGETTDTSTTENSITLQSSITGTSQFRKGLTFRVKEGIVTQDAADISFVSGASDASAGNIIFRTTTVGSGANTERVRIDHEGKVGFNEDDPLTQLHVTTSDSSTTPTGVPTQITLQNTNDGAGTGSGLAFRRGSVNYARVVGLAQATSGGELSFQTSDSGGSLFEHLRINSNTTFNFNGGGSAAKPVIYFDGDTNTGFWHPSADTLAFSTAGSERLRITSSGNVGIGTDTPAVVLETNVASGNNEFRQDVAGTARAQFIASATDQYIVNNGSGSQTFWTGGAQRLTINSTGNVGIGETNPQAKLDISTGATLSQATYNGQVKVGAYSTTGNTDSGVEWQVRTDGSGYGFRAININAGGGNQWRLQSRDNSASWTDNIVVDGGNVGIGVAPTTVGAYKVLHIESSDADAGGYIRLESATAGEYVNIFNFNTTLYMDAQAHVFRDKSGNDKLIVDTGGTCTAQGVFRGTPTTGAGTPTFSFDGDTNTGMYHVTADTLGFSTGGSERMRIDSSGNLLVGGTGQGVIKLEGPATGTEGGQLDIECASGLGTYSIDTYSDDMRFLTSTTSGNYLWYVNNNSSVAMTLDSSGNLLVGKTSSAVTSAGISAVPSGRINLSSTGTTALTIQAFYRNGSASAVGSIATTSTGTAYYTSSDMRLKENIVDAPAGNIDAIRVRSFDWKSDGSHQKYGVIAQELFEVAPEAVSQGDTEDDTWAVDYSKLVPMMIKEIQDLKAEVAALKGE